MKKFIVSVLALTLFATVAYAGPAEAYVQQQQTAYQPSQDWFRDREWNFDLFGAYAFPGNNYRSDKYLGTDHAWGGGIDVNYMFNRYLGIGVEGYGLAAEEGLGQASGNLIFRYPIPGTRFAPYGYAGGGVIFNGTRVEELADRDRSIRFIRRNSDVEAMGQFGGGFEFRITPNVGVINDFSWNVINGDTNNFGMMRSGVRFAF
ncbi:MAG: hypothetical protein ABI540_09715 [Spartobacteria bacterium]